MWGRVVRASSLSPSKKSLCGPWEEWSGDWQSPGKVLKPLGGSVNWRGCDCCHWYHTNLFLSIHKVSLSFSVSFILNRVLLVCFKSPLPLCAFQFHFLCKAFSLPPRYFQSILNSGHPLFLRVSSVYPIQTNIFSQLYPSLSQALVIFLFLNGCTTKGFLQWSWS